MPWMGLKSDRWRQLRGAVPAVPTEGRLPTDRVPGSGLRGPEHDHRKQRHRRDHDQRSRHDPIIHVSFRGAPGGDYGGRSITRAVWRVCVPSRAKRAQKAFSGMAFGSATRKSAASSSRSRSARYSGRPMSRRTSVCRRLTCCVPARKAYHQLSRIMEVDYKSAWFLAHRIREAMRDGVLAPMGGTGNPVEVDETYIGRLQGQPKPRKGGAAHKSFAMESYTSEYIAAGCPAEDGCRTSIAASIAAHARSGQHCSESSQSSVQDRQLSSLAASQASQHSNNL
jgi:hypothetical protein